MVRPSARARMALGCPAPLQVIFPASQVDSCREEGQEQARIAEVFVNESVESVDHLDWRTSQVHTVSDFAAHAGCQECRANAVACDVAHGDVAHVLAGEVHLRVVTPHTGERLVSHVDFGSIGPCRRGQQAPVHVGRQQEVRLRASLLDVDQLLQLRNAAAKPPYEVHVGRRSRGVMPSSSVHPIQSPFTPPHYRLRGEPSSTTVGARLPRR